MDFLSNQQQQRGRLQAKNNKILAIKQGTFLNHIAPAVLYQQ
jgi:hypothetical protein